MKKRQRPISKYYVPALEKGLDILETLANSSGPHSLSELARSLNRSSSELFRMLDSLERRGYILKDSMSGNYRLSLKLYELAHTHSPVEQLLSAAAKPMRDVTEAIRESCHLSVLSRGKLLVLAQEESPDKVRLSVEVGARFSPIHTVSGRMLLAQLESTELTEFLAVDSDYQDLSKTLQKEFLTDLKEIREQGVSTALNETLVGVKDVAVLVGNPRIGIMAALAATAWMGPAKKVSIQKIKNALQECADGITRNIGLTPT
ncbi:MAG: IclR family transcriptional regulator [Acidobacteria bacterium]|nr:IclR family transcriptional regulator [Acidobacteriota bacterium]MCI0623491.1 IclR family transcriptional regulator [Acidobacteriota bacterium]